MVQIQKADPAARRKAIRGILIGALVGAVLFFLLQGTMGNINPWIESHAELLVEHHYLAFLLMLIPVAPIIVLSGYLIKHANKVVRTQRFPPPGTPVIRDVRVIEGPSAVLRGRVALVLLWIILLSASAIPLLIWYIFYTVSCVS